jgi:hypothetical protein
VLASGQISENSMFAALKRRGRLVPNESFSPAPPPAGAGRRTPQGDGTPTAPWYKPKAPSTAQAKTLSLQEQRRTAKGAVKGKGGTGSALSAWECPACGLPHANAFTRYCRDPDCCCPSPSTRKKGVTKERRVLGKGDKDRSHFRAMGGRGGKERTPNGHQRIRVGSAKHVCCHTTTIPRCRAEYANTHGKVS